MSARAIFVGGTSSNAGKSWMATAICAWLHARGVAVAPFKAQNMSNNSYPTADGGEIGRAQVAQAEACGLAPEPAMNPILLKPNGNGSSQVIVNGRVWKTLPAREYYELAGELRTHVLAAYEDLSRRFEFIVIEGAGSVSELNLRAVDLANLDLVTRVRAPWILVADIERGGVFASVVGTVALLTPEQRELFRGFVINKFCGDMSLFDDGVRILEAHTGAPCLGVFPNAPDIAVDAEDTLALDTRPRRAAPAGARIAIIRLPRLSNATDFRLLSWAEWIAQPVPGHFDFVILPGSKTTIADLKWLRDTGLAEWVTAQHRAGATVIGVCGGFQMLGRTIRDALGVESPDAMANGLGLLPVDTVMRPDKTTVLRTAWSRGGVKFRAYEIHLGVTKADLPMQPFARLPDGGAEGACGPGVIGTYLHGAFENADVCAETFGVEVGAVSKAAHYRRLGEWFSRYARLDLFGF
jgi:adenosylcobyric acid synthase